MAVPKFPVSPYRENPDRCIIIDGVIDNDMFSRITPDILRLRAKNADPITVYINSPGGLIQIADQIYDLLKAPDQDNRRRDIVTVVTGLAASAAADLLARGDYSISYPSAIIHLHGTRHGEGDELTLEHVTSAAKYLRRINEERALRMAHRVFKRFVIIFLTIKEEHRPANDKSYVLKIDKLCDSLKRKLSSTPADICDKALTNYRHCLELLKPAVEAFEANKGKHGIHIQCEVIRQVALYEADVLLKKDPDARFSSDSLDHIMDEFKALIDYLTGDYIGSLESFMEYPTFLLTPEELENMPIAIAQNSEEMNKWIFGTTKHRLKEIWYFVLSYCRLFQKSENLITPEDAYWLGVVNEVLGLELPSFRTMHESSLVGDPQLPLI